ncbi:MAG: hypothetical protein WAU41_05680 [Gaiellaceae bacterium]
MTTTCLHVEIEAPDGHAALELEYRLAHLAPTTVGRDGHWFVEIDADTDTLDEIEGAVAGWLRGIGELAATVYLDGRRTDRVRAQGGV